MSVYLVDTENVHSCWQDVVYLARPGDKVLLFYTEKSPLMYIGQFNFLQDTGVDVVYVPCYRTGKNNDNALDFQLVSMLGYMIHENMVAGRPECYFIVSCDGGFDSVVEHWIRKNIFVQRLVANVHANQVAPTGPVLNPDKPSLELPFAVRPDFTRIRKYAKLFSEALMGSEYYTYRHEIAMLFVPIWDENLPADKFALSFRNALTGKYGLKNDVYKRLKPVIDGFRVPGFSLDKVELDPPMSMPTPTRTILPLISPVPASSVSEFGDEFACDDASAEPIVDVSGPVAQSAKPPALKVDMKSVSIMMSRKEMLDLRAAIRAKLPDDMKKYDGDITKMQIMSINRDMATWHIDYLRLLQDNKQIVWSRVPDALKFVVHQYFTKPIKSELFIMFGR